MSEEQFEVVDHAEATAVMIDRFARAQNKEGRSNLLAFLHLLAAPYEADIFLSIGRAGDLILVMYGEGAAGS